MLDVVPILLGFVSSGSLLASKALEVFIQNMRLLFESEIVIYKFILVVHCRVERHCSRVVCIV